MGWSRSVLTIYFAKYIIKTGKKIHLSKDLQMFLQAYCCGTGENMASIKDVAAEAGVSLSTASIVANGKASERKISEKTQNKVLMAMRKLNYIPNVSAKTLRRGESQRYIVALFWNFDFRGIMMNRFLFGLQKKITEENVNMSIIVHPYQTGELSKEAASFTSGEFHAAIIGNADKSDLEYLHSSSFNVPIILYNRILEGFCSVNIDDEKLGVLAAEHLYSQGYRCPVIVHGTQNFPGAASREEAFSRRMGQYGIQMFEPRIIYAGNSLKGGYECGEMLVERARRSEKMPDSYFCSSDFIALGLINAWLSKGWSSDKAGVIAVGNSDPQHSKYHTPSLTVMNVPIEEMAEQCAQFLIDRMYAPQTEPVQKFFKTELFARDSTRRKI